MIIIVAYITNNYKGEYYLYFENHTDIKYYSLIILFKSIDIEVRIFKINDWNFITIPGEIFSTLTKPIRESGNNIILGYMNGYYSYILDEKAYDKGYYVASSTPFKRGEGEKLVSIIMEKLKHLDFI